MRHAATAGTAAAMRSIHSGLQTPRHQRGSADGFPCSTRFSVNYPLMPQPRRFTTHITTHINQRHTTGARKYPALPPSATQLTTTNSTQPHLQKQHKRSGGTCACKTTTITTTTTQSPQGQTPPNDNLQVSPANTPHRQSQFPIVMPIACSAANLYTIPTAAADKPAVGTHPLMSRKGLAPLGCCAWATARGAWRPSPNAALPPFCLALVCIAAHQRAGRRHARTPAVYEDQDAAW